MRLKSLQWNAATVSSSGSRKGKKRHGYFSHMVAAYVLCWTYRLVIVKVAPSLAKGHIIIIALNQQ
jgi:hypothetical protein